MARNAHPEVTRRRILDAAQNLFAERGYEHTSIQNIVDALGDLSKGAIYHHFASKEAILEALTERDNDAHSAAIRAIVDDKQLDALHKVRMILRYSLTDAGHAKVTRAVEPLLDDPMTFSSYMRFWREQLPQTWLQLIDEGAADGSIVTQYPREAAQLLAMLLNYWLFPHFYPASKAEYRHRVQCLATMMEAIDMPLFDDELVELMVNSAIGACESDK